MENLSPCLVPASLQERVAVSVAQARMENYALSMCDSWDGDAQYFLQLASGDHLVAFWAFRSLGIAHPEEEDAFKVALYMRAFNIPRDPQRQLDEEDEP